MNVILLEKMRNLGGLGETVRVRSGYGRNFLIPQGKAVPATAENLRQFEERRAELESAAAEQVAAAEARAAKLVELSVTLTRQAGEGGKLFGSIGAQDIAEAITAVAGEIDRKEVRMPVDGGLRNTGEYEVVIHLHPEVEQTVKVVVAAE